MMEEFIPPPEAPVFQPTLEEFKDPVSYITRIRPVVVNTGICKIRPPQGWKPPFAIDVDKFKFTPRVQPLNELEAKTRVKLNFLDHLAKFWELQGIVFKIPNVDHSPLDLHGLFKAVTKRGGFDEVSHNRLWTRVTKDMKYTNHTVAGSLRVNYERYLYPYERFLVKMGKLELKTSMSHDSQRAATPRLATPSPVKSETSTPTKCKYGLRQNRRRPSHLEDPDYTIDLDEDNPEFKKLAFTAPGPKNSFAPIKQGAYFKKERKRKWSVCLPGEDDSFQSTTGSSAAVKREGDEGSSTVPVIEPPKHMGENIHVFECLQDFDTKAASKPLSVDEVKCSSCGSGDCDEELLLCDSCDASYHMFCLDPPLHSLPPGDWRCPTCVAQVVQECAKPQDGFGFEQAEKVYSLQSFGQMANTFKQQHFNLPPKDVPYSAVEKEFWRLVTSIDDEVVVEYGADLLTSQVGSGFPKGHHAQTPEEERYAKSGWNLNNMPNLRGSVLSYIDADISGMKVPWAYVGMCFSCFCWHIEDHWSYSINYLHWGEPKTWYGVPSAYAESLEAVMKEQAPELFENQPDLLHHLVTTLSPTILMKHGIPVVRTDQCAGEFVVTFPRAYHAGFNQGFNFAEAVNFSLADWLPVGRESICHYRVMRRNPVFSHDELICKLIMQPDQLELCLLNSTMEDAKRMVKEETKLRSTLNEMGVTQEQRELFEIASDDERQCAECRTCCFLSAIRCPCSPQHLVCPHHLAKICRCPNSRKVLRFRYTMVELQQLVDGLCQRTTAYSDWMNRVERLVDGLETEKADLVYLQSLVQEANEKGYNTSEVYDELQATLQDVKKCASTAVQLVTTKPKTRYSNVDVRDVKEFLSQVEGLPCKLPEADVLKEKLVEVEQFQVEACEEVARLNQAASDNTAPPQTLSTARLEALIERGGQFEFHVPELDTLKLALQQNQWVAETREKLRLEMQTVDGLKAMAKQGTNLMHGSTAVEEVVGKVKSLLSTSQEWEQKAKAALKQKPYQDHDFFNSMLLQAKEIPVQLPTVQVICDMLDRAEEWSKEAQLIQDSDTTPHFDQLKSMLASGRPIPVKLELLAQLESRFAAAKGWVDRAARTFLKKTSNNSVLEVLLPRSQANFFLRHINRGGKKKLEGELAINPNPLSELKGDRIKEMEKIHDMEQTEQKMTIQLRNENLQKMERDEELKNGVISGPQVVYCMCRKPESGYMLQCELCHEWYHAACLHIPKGKRIPGKDIGKDSRFICSICQRTRRPRLDAIISLLISLQKVPVAISEGTALHCIAERAISWQRRARQAISNCSGVLEAAKQQKRRIEEIKGHIRRWRNEAQSNRDGSSVTSIQAQLASSAGSVLHHYETELQRLRSEYAGLSGSKRTELENLLMEGDLLEVTMDEETQLWQLLQQDAESSLAFEKSGREEEVEKPTQTIGTQATPEPLQTNEDEEKRKKRKRKDPSPSPSVSSTASTDSPRLVAALGGGAAPPPSKKKKKSRTTGGTKPHHHPSPAPSNSSSNRSRTPLSDTPKFNRSGSNESNDGLGCSEEILEEEEEESECSATKCLQPMVDEISWVQCDKCQEWFHCMCVRLTKEMAEKIDSYVCDGCKHVLLNSKASQSMMGSSGGSSVSGGGGGVAKSSIGLMASIKQGGISGVGHSSTARLHSHLQT